MDIEAASRWCGSTDTEHLDGCASRHDITLSYNMEEAGRVGFFDLSLHSKSKMNQNDGQFSERRRSLIALQ